MVRIQVLVDHRGLGQDHFFSYRWNDALATGTLVKVPFGKKSLLGLVVPEGLEEPYEGELRELDAVLLELGAFGDEVWAMISWLRYSCRVGWVTCFRTIFPGAVRKRLLRSENLVSRQAPRAITGLHEVQGVVTKLTKDQQNVLQRIRGSDQLFHLIHGVTGSGKTEVYLRLCQEQIKRGKNCLVLVPEVSLTPQIWGRFERVFPEQLAVLHSGLTEAQRRNQWARCQAHEARVVLGTRSAIFAPLMNLGLILLDEEHDSSYKNQSQPYYHARQIAFLRSRWHPGSKIVLGSATPSIESYYEATQGRFQLLELKNRATGGHLPRVHLIDTKVESPAFGKLLSPPLVRALQDNHIAGNQSLLLLNRRGFFGVMACTRCSWKAECDSCSVSLTYYRKRNRLQCHYCGKVEAVPQLCPQCGAPLDTGFNGGTEMLEQELCERIPGVQVARMDRDNVTNAREHTEMLSRLQDADIDILLGTQMIAKGLDFPNITLVGVVGGDEALSLPDFRASERTFQLLAQVAGRAGRGLKSGQVMIQVREPSHIAVLEAARHDYLRFYRQEIGWRLAAGYPPAQRIVKIGIEGKKSNDTEILAHKVAELVARYAEDRVQVLGPAVCAIARIKKAFRWQCLLKGPSLNACLLPIHRALGLLEASEKRWIRVDPDPVEML